MMYIMFGVGGAVLVGLIVLIVVLCSCAGEDSDDATGTCAASDAYEGKPIDCTTLTGGKKTQLEATVKCTAKPAGGVTVKKLFRLLHFTVPLRLCL